MTNLNIEKLTEAQLDAHIELGSSAYSSPEVTDREHFGWKHLANPYGASLCISVSKDDGLLTGHAFALQRTFWLTPSVSVHGALVTDLVVRPAYRSAATTVEITRAMKAPEGLAIVVHTSNETSDVIYRKLFKLPIAFTMAACGLPVGVCGSIARAPKIARFAKLADLLISPWRWMLGAARLAFCRWSGLRLDGEPSATEKQDIFAAHRQRAGAHFERSAEFLDWRFSQGPLFNADIKWIWRKDNCLGYLAFKRVKLNGLSVMVILDIVLTKSPASIDAVALKLMAINEAIVAQADAVFTLANRNSAELKWLFSFPFIPIPDRYLPHATPIFVHSSSAAARPQEFDDMFLTLADLDYF